MRDLRIVFMGTPEFAVSILKEILVAGYTVAGVITAPDKPAGRGRKLHESAVKTFAVSKDLPVLQPTNLKSPEFLEDLKSLNPNIQVVVAFRMLPETVWNLPEFGTFNLHASLLPQYRGAAPINWAIINGEEITGVSTFFLDEKIDTGATILQQSVEIDKDENAGSLHDKLMHTGAKLVLDTLELIKENKAVPEKQQESTSLKDAPKLTKENTRINWNNPIDEIYNLIRGLSPYPTAWTELINNGETLPIKIYEAKKYPEDHELRIGDVVVKNKELLVAVKNGYIQLLEIQIPGKRKMKTRDLLNGYQFENHAKVL
ncbi:methionyl-tRNA formyltransferase [Antarcticibacterium arcticum]|uniref:Methionyl-tRNA formyltransferase n=1 Tax=Antarcticibacterium arcticum TaxID=2585771 RepID=A0A5B8YMY3_9FLAO|nr:methionyl-tRNA formyltransferase [Antarcticibacterium arcticum]QED37119.1 methionyl-tRNA formyltransferase [Antarcticibacterium arcticum]